MEIMSMLSAGAQGCLRAVLSELGSALQSLAAEIPTARKEGWTAGRWDEGQKCL